MTADLILQNGVVHTGSVTRQLASAVAVTNGRIVAVGGPNDVASHRGPATREIDMQGGMLLPGFFDAHCHPAMAGYGMTQCDLHSIAGREQTWKAIESYANGHPNRDWILGGGWSMSDFPGGLPTREELDAVVSDRPAALTNRDYHGMWVNSKALEVAGITDSTPDPEGGRIERDASGRATGMLQEQAMQLMFALTPDPSPEDRMAGILAAQAYYHSLGITSLSDALVDSTRRPPTRRSRQRQALDAGARHARLGSHGGPRSAGRAARATDGREHRAGSTATRSSSSTTACSRTSPPR